MEHKLDCYIDSPYKRIVFCNVCGQEEPTGECKGDVITNALENGFKEIFGSRTEYGSKFLKEVLDSQK